MCFRPPTIAPVEIKYEKPDYGDLPDLGTGTPVERAMPVYGDRAKASQRTARSLLMPFKIGS